MSPTTGEEPELVALHNTTDATQAIRWIRHCLNTVLYTVNPDQRDHVTRWINSDHTQAVDALTHGQPVTITATYADAHLELTARPVLFLPLLPPPGKPVIRYTLLCAFTNRHTEFNE
ncbi:hypothetical protein [Streptacidiphilus sp. P02-A3a]|uniref:hypothetical protein n=1 Tax=Streptacidiphilus sp. P02-A3a TaxID=2704468 RepID=UPI0015FD4068|nr:hypothetical protein [Streptacidiphilus sp. P02-A3a]QMU68114.1 hypothetical protein GXP74_07640 [Streptacidiphilus sp. P02-A3a]